MVQGDAAYITGFDEVIENLNKAIAELKSNSLRGLKEAAKMIYTSMDTVTPIIPEDTGRLRNSWKVEDDTTKEGEPYVVMGFEDVPYGVAVHEMLESSSGKAINWTRPNSGPKFFEASVKRNSSQVLEILKSNVQV